MEISIKWNVCRICLEEVDAVRMKVILGDCKLIRQIFDCSGVMVKPGDSLPEKICCKCLLLLRYAVKFRTTCRNADDYLHSVMQKAKSTISLFNADKHAEETEALELTDDEQLYDENPEVLNSWNNVMQEIAMSISEDSEDSKQSKIIIQGSVKKIMNEMEHVPENNISDNKNEKEKCQVQNVPKNSLEFITKNIPKEVNFKPCLKNIYANDCVDYDINEECAIEKDIDTLDERDNDNDLFSFKLKRNRSRDNSEFIEDGEEENYSEIPSVPSADGVGVVIVVQDTEKNSSKSKSMGNETKEKAFPTKEVLQNDIDECVKNQNRATDTEFFYILNTNEINRDLNDSVNSTSNINAHSKKDMEQECSEDYLVDGVEALSNSEKLDGKLNDNADLSLSERLFTNTQRLNTFICNICGNNFTSRSLLNYHIRVHRNERSYECELCFKRFTTACNLSTHMRIHTGEKRYKCQYCGRRFTDRSTHIKHERVHTNERPFECNVCGKTFSLSSSLRAHEKVHTDEKPYKCEHCIKSFRLAHQLKAHLNTLQHRAIITEHKH